MNLRQFLERLLATRGSRVRHARVRTVGGAELLEPRTVLSTMSSFDSIEHRESVRPIDLGPFPQPAYVQRMPGETEVFFKSSDASYFRQELTTASPMTAPFAKEGTGLGMITMSPSPGNSSPFLTAALRDAGGSSLNVGSRSLGYEALPEKVMPLLVTSGNTTIRGVISPDFSRAFLDVGRGTSFSTNMMMFVGVVRITPAELLMVRNPFTDSVERTTEWRGGLPIAIPGSRPESISLVQLKGNESSAPLSSSLFNTPNATRSFSAADAAFATSFDWLGTDDSSGTGRVQSSGQRNPTRLAPNSAESDLLALLASETGDEEEDGAGRLLGVVDGEEAGGLGSDESVRNALRAGRPSSIAVAKNASLPGDARASSWRVAGWRTEPTLADISNWLPSLDQAAGLQWSPDALGFIEQFSTGLGDSATTFAAAASPVSIAIGTTPLDLQAKMACDFAMEVNPGQVAASSSTTGQTDANRPEPVQIVQAVVAE